MDDEAPWVARNRANLERLQEFFLRPGMRRLKGKLDLLADSQIFSALRSQTADLQQFKFISEDRRKGNAVVKRGRPRGTSYESQDILLVVEINQLVVQGMQLEKALGEVALRAAGAGTVESKKTRLRKLRSRKSEKKGE